MVLPLISRDMATVLDVCIRALSSREYPNCRASNLFASVAGHGHGKTRLLEELRYEQLKAQGDKILPLAITLDSTAMRLEPYKADIFKQVSEDYVDQVTHCKRLNYAYAIIKRLAGVLYGIDVTELGKIISPSDILPYSHNHDATSALIHTALLPILPS